MMEKIIFRIQRYNPDKNEAPYFQEFEVPWKKGMTVLDGLFYIQGKLDSTLAFRSSCRAGVCGSCGMHINGKYRLACETQANMFGGLVVLRPLGHFPIIKDLVVDLDGFWAKFKSIKPYLIPADPDPGNRERPQSAADANKLTGLYDCILCTCCHASCPMTDSHPEYLGPAILLKENRFVVDSRDKGGLERLEAVDSDHGVWRCHTVFNCTEVCPKSLDPAGSIAHLKRTLMAKRLIRPRSS